MTQVIGIETIFGQPVYKLWIFYTLPWRYIMFAKVVAVSLLTLASGQLLAAECKVTVDSTDQMSYNTKEITIDKSCKTFTV